MIKSIIQYAKDKTRPFRRKLRAYKREFIKRYRVKKYADMLFRERLGYSIDWRTPKDLNEKINWLAFNTDTSEWSRLADKYLVREFVKERGCEEILIPLLGVWNNVEDINLNMLPDEFVIKTNCGSGDVVLVNKNNIDWGGVLCHLKNALEKRIGIESAEPHYLRIRQCIIAEQRLSPINRGDLLDYKIWCFNGRPHLFFICSNRDIEKRTMDISCYDLEWNRRDDYIVDKYKNDISIPKPKNLELLLEYATILSYGFPQVRVDFYIVDDKIYFGEMTFTSYSGRMPYFTKDALNIMGELIDLPTKK